MKNINKNFIINEDIRCKEVRVISEKGEQMGILSPKEALQIAEERDLDLVLVAPNAKPPVCKIVNYSKYLYEQAKKDKLAKKKQKTINIKEIRLSTTIEEHDIGIKANNARKFLKSEDKVKVTIRFRGREADYSYIGNRILDVFFSKVEDICVIEKKPKLEGKNMIMILAHKKA